MFKKICLINLMLLLVASAEVQGGFTGPIEVLTTSYGNGDGQVGLQPGDSGDEFPWRIAVSHTGRVALCDEANDRVSIFKSNGAFERSIAILSTGVVFDVADSIYLKAKFRKFNKDGVEVFVKDVGYHDIFSVDSNIIGYDRDKKTYTVYAPTGQIIKTSTTRPLELGVVKERPISETQYQITIKYPDKTYELTTNGTFMSYMRDMKGYVYGVNDDSLWKFDQCGKQVGELIMPDEQTEEITSNAGKSLSIPAQYGQPVIAPNGDVYTWKKTAFKYNIVKWTWVDDPNVPTGPDAPTGLSLMPSTSGLYLTWTASPGDPGCVTGYEISRATSAGGVATTVATVNAGVVKYNDTSASAGTTYYYKVRAKAGSEYSPYTSEVSGKR